jgi:predicted DsbA family dithiol-disulfide isomerase
VIDDGEGAAEVSGLEAHAHHIGIRGVPLMRIGNTVISGTGLTSVLAAALRKAATAEPAMRCRRPV